MFHGFYPRYDLEARIQHTKLDSWGRDFPSARMSRVEEVGTADFSSVMLGIVLIAYAIYLFIMLITKNGKSANDKKQVAKDDSPKTEKQVEDKKEQSKTEK